jgi:hypothetical protein
MLLKKITKSTIISIVSALLFLTVSPNLKVFAANTDADPVQQSNDVVEIRVSNQEIFDAFEELGYDIEDYLSDEEIENALLEDKMNNVQGDSQYPMMTRAFARGHTGLTIVNSNTANLHLNNVLTTLLLTAGVGAVSAALLKIGPIAAFFGSGSIKAGALGNMLSGAAGMLYGSYSRGISITFRYSIYSTRITQVLAQ